MTNANITQIDVNMFITLALSVLIVYLGNFLRKKIKFLNTFCIPASVVGGFIFAIITCVLFASGTAIFNFDDTLKNVCMTIFFTTVGFQANIKELKRGGKTLLIFLIVTSVLTVLQNVFAITLGELLGVGSGIGLCSGSIPMVGGHGTSSAFGPILEGAGVLNATTICTTCATYGLIAGSLMGGPMARSLITKNKLRQSDSDALQFTSDAQEQSSTALNHGESLTSAAFQIAIAMGAGVIISQMLERGGLTVPNYIGAMIVAAIMRNIGEQTEWFETPIEELNEIGSICLSLFLGAAMATLRLWELANLALPLAILLVGQTIITFLYIRFVIFNTIGRDYDAAVICAGTCGFALGATPNAMANMEAVTGEFQPSIKAFLIVPIVGGMFIDFINSIVITLFVNMI